MTLLRQLITFSNRLLSKANLKLDSQTQAKREVKRLDQAAGRSVFTSPLYRVPLCYENHEAAPLLAALPKYEQELVKLRETNSNTVGYQLENGFYTSPDTEILYTLIRELKPQRILEIGCGNSTRITRQAIRDGSLQTKLTCLDPYPRRDVAEFADELHLHPVENSPALKLLSDLGPGDILFIDTSHELHPSNDCAYIYCVLLPQVPVGVIVHIHDIFLPYEYPEHFVRGDAGHWGEQYIVSVLLQNETRWAAIWPGHYLQRSMPNFATHFPLMTNGLAQSLWLRKL